MQKLKLMTLTVLTGAAISACGQVGPGALPTPSSTAAVGGTSEAGTSATSGASTSATSGAGTSATSGAGTSATSGAGTSATSGAGTSATSGAGTVGTAAPGTMMGTTTGTSVAGTAVTGGTSTAATAEPRATTGGTTTAGTSTAGTTTAGTATSSTGDTLVDAAIAQGDFTILVQALQATGLDQTLSEAGPYTVFAPTDTAFEALPAGTLEALLANPDLLTQLLSYHVVEGNLTAANLSSETSVTSLEGTPITVSASGSTVTLNGNTTVTNADIETGNGVIHGIDKVLLPEGLEVPTS